MVPHGKSRNVALPLGGVSAFGMMIILSSSQALQTRYPFTVIHPPHLMQHNESHIRFTDNGQQLTAPLCATQLLTAHFYFLFR